jgi:hypothetical protein
MGVMVPSRGYTRIAPGTVHDFGVAQYFSGNSDLADAAKTAGSGFASTLARASWGSLMNEPRDAEASRRRSKNFLARGERSQAVRQYPAVSAASAKSLFP